MKGHIQSARHPATQRFATHISPEPTAPGLQSPWLAQALGAEVAAGGTAVPLVTVRWA